MAATTLDGSYFESPLPGPADPEYTGLSFACWAYVTAAQTGFILNLSPAPGTLNAGFAGLLMLTDQLAMRAQVQDGRKVEALHPTAPPVGEWFPVVGVYDDVSEDPVIQWGGHPAQAFTTTGDVTPTSYSHAAIGKVTAGDGTVDARSNFRCAYSRIWSRALTEAERAAYLSSTSLADINAIDGTDLIFSRDLISDGSSNIGGDALSAYGANATFDGASPFAAAVPGIPSNTLEYQGSPVVATTATISVHAGTDLKTTADYRIAGVALTNGAFGPIDLSGTSIAVGDPIVVEALPSSGPGIILRTTAGDIA